jgi:hypothetical protein
MAVAARTKPTHRRPLLPGLARLRHYPPAWLRPDSLAGITVAAYLIPQCMAYGELAGVGPVQGLWARTHLFHSTQRHRGLSPAPVGPGG